MKSNRIFKFLSKSSLYILIDLYPRESKKLLKRDDKKNLLSNNHLFIMDLSLSPILKTFDMELHLIHGEWSSKLGVKQFW